MKAVHVAVELYSPLNNNWPRDQYGIKNASTVLNVIDHWTAHWHATDQIGKFTVAHAMQNFLVQKVLATVTRQLWFQPMANLQLLSKYSFYRVSIFHGNFNNYNNLFINLVLMDVLLAVKRLLLALDANVAGSLYMKLKR